MIITSVFPNASAKSRRDATHSFKAASNYEQMSFALLDQQAAYKDWQERDTSCLLWLSGQTATDARTRLGSTISWLSLATVHVSELIEDEKHTSNILLYYNCHPGLREEKKATTDVLKSLLFQIISRRPRILAHRLNHITSSLERLVPTEQQNTQLWPMNIRQDKSHITQKENIKILVGLIHEMLTEVYLSSTLASSNDQNFLDGGNSGIVYIIIDRIDQCFCKSRYLMDELASLVMDEKLRVKIMATHDIAYGDKWETENLDEDVR